MIRIITARRLRELERAAKNAQSGPSGCYICRPESLDAADEACGTCEAAYWADPVPVPCELSGDVEVCWGAYLTVSTPPDQLRDQVYGLLDDLGRRAREQRETGGATDAL